MIRAAAIAALLPTLVVVAHAQSAPASTISWSRLGTTYSGVPVDTTRIGSSFSLDAGQSISLRDRATSYARVYVDNPTVLSAYTVNPHQVVISGVAPGAASVVLTDSEGHTTAYTVKVNANVASLQRAMENAFPLDTIHVHSNEGTVVLTGYVLSKDEYKKADTIAGAFSKHVFNALRVTPAHAREVRLDVTFAEIDRSKLAQSSFNFLSLGKNIALTGTGQSQSFTSPTGIGNSSPVSQGVSVTSPMQALLFNSGFDVGATLQDLEQNNIAQILAQPDINTISGHIAHFIEGGEFPYPVIQPGGSAGGQSSITIEFVPYGVMLTFEPVVLDDGTIRLYVEPSVSALDYSNEVAIAGYSIPAIDTRAAKTYIELKNGQTFALSGLLDHRITNEFAHMPGITKIPVLGWFFRSKNKQASTTNLVVLVTAHLVNPLSAPPPVPALPKLVTPYMNQHNFDITARKEGR